MKNALIRIKVFRRLNQVFDTLPSDDDQLKDHELKKLKMILELFNGYQEGKKQMVHYS